MRSFDGAKIQGRMRGMPPGVGYLRIMVMKSRICCMFDRFSFFRLHNGGAPQDRFLMGMCGCSLVGQGNVRGTFS